MAVDVETLRLELQSNAENFAAQIAKSENALEKLQTQLKLSPQNFDAIDAAMDKEVATLEVYRRKLADTEVALEKLDAAAGKPINKLKGLGQAGLQTGRVIQDFAQGGVGGVLNNIEQFTQAIGGGPGMAGAMTGLGVAIFLVKPYLDDFMEALNPEKPYRFVTSLSALQDKIKEIEAKPVKLAIDMVELDLAKRQLDELQKNLAAFKAAGEGKTVFEAEAGRQFKENFEQSGQEGAQARDAILKAEVARITATDPQFNQAKADQAKAAAAIENLKEFLASGAATDDQMVIAMADLETQRKKLQAALDRERQANIGINQQASATIGGLFRGAEAGNQPNARADLARRLRAAGAENLARATELSNPEEMQAQEEADAAADASIEQQQAANKARAENAKKAKKAENDFIDELNKQGQEGEPEALREIRAINQGKEQAKKDQAKFLADQAKAAGVGTDAREKALREGSLDEEAEAEAARLRRDRRLSPEQREEILRRQVGQRVSAAMPGLNPLEQGTLTNRFVRGADQAVADQTAQLMDQGMSQQQAALEVVNQTQAIVAQLLAKQRGIGNAIGQLRQNNANLARQVQAPGNWNGNPLGGQ